MSGTREKFSQHILLSISIQGTWQVCWMHVFLNRCNYYNYISDRPLLPHIMLFYFLGPRDIDFSEQAAWPTLKWIDCHAWVSWIICKRHVHWLIFLKIASYTLPCQSEAKQ